MSEEPEGKKPEAPSHPPGEPKAREEKPAAAKPPAGPAVEPWSGDIVEALRRAFPEAAIEGQTYLGQHVLIVPREAALPVTMYLKAEFGFNMLADLTAVDYPQREKRFEVIYQLYSFTRNERLRVKAPLGEQETIESVVPVWAAADWLEREVYDMFGIVFDHHPNMRRILLPDEWQGFPLRKDYSILQQDVQWVRENLHIESGQ